MGLWGKGLYQNDTALDVKDQFEELLRKGNNVEQITKHLIAKSACLLNDPHETVFFWLALADTQWNCGVLVSSVKEKALQCIDKAKNEELLLLTQLDPTMLDKLKEKLLSPFPISQMHKQRKLYRCTWSIGDVYAYRLESDLAKEKGLHRRYLLIQKVDERVWSPGHIVPIVYVKITENDSIPISMEEYNQLEYVQTWFTKFEERFLPIDFSRPKEDIAEKEKLHYEVDDFGFLPQYRLCLVSTSQKQIPKTLEYLGNFWGSMPPEKEFIPHIKTNIVSETWGKYGSIFERAMIQKYCNYNRRELSIYQKD